VRRIQTTVEPDEKQHSSTRGDFIKWVCAVRAGGRGRRGGDTICEIEPRLRLDSLVPIDTKGGSIKVTAGFKSSFFVYFNLRRGMRDFYIYNTAASGAHPSAAACRCTFCSLSPLMCRVRKENMRVRVCLCVNLIEITLRWVCLPAAAEEMKLLCFK
jgi:hypothetical protein